MIENPPNMASVLMVSVIAELIYHIKNNDKRNCQCNRQPKHVNDGKNLVFFKNSRAVIRLYFSMEMLLIMSN